MKKLLFCFVLILSNSVFAIEQPIVKEETTPPAASGPITAEQIPPLITGAKPITKPDSTPTTTTPAPAPTTIAPLKKAENESHPAIFNDADTIND